MPERYRDLKVKIKVSCAQLQKQSNFQPRVNISLLTLVESLAQYNLFSFMKELLDCISMTNSVFRAYTYNNYRYLQGSTH